MGTKEKPCKLIGGISGVLGLIVIIISCIFLAKLISCDDDDHKDKEHAYGEKEPSYGFKDKDKAPEYGYKHDRPGPPGHPGAAGPPGFGPPGFPGGGPHGKPRWKRSADDKKYSHPQPYQGGSSSGGEFTTFYACAICGIIFGLAQLLFSGLFCSYVNEKNCKKMAITWCAIHGLLIIAFVAIFIAMFVEEADWKKGYKLFKYAKYGHFGYFDCFKYNKAFVGLVGLNWIALLILCGAACWCSKKSNGAHDHDHEGGESQKRHDDKVHFNKQ